MRKPELLSPVGDFECLKVAVQNGADAVYLGASSFNARQRASNFDLKSLEEAIKYAKLRNVNVHLTLNTLIKDEEFEDAVNLAISAYNLGVDAIIIQDLGLANYLLKNYPEIPIHASTQLTVHNLQGVLELQKLGFSRVVLSRELSIDEIKNICKNSKIEIETFIHGALCISYSGQCLFSSIVGNRSGNRGLCAQPCRLPYELYDSTDKQLDKGYLLSPRDLNATNFLPDFIKSGVDCFKIEGRMKTPEYVAEVTRYYRKYIDLICENIELSNDELISLMEKNLNIKNNTSKLTDKEELIQVFNRGGFSEGHLPSKENTNLIYKEKSNNMGIFIGKIQKINSNKGHLFIKLEDTLEIGDRITTEFGTYTISELMENGKNIKTAYKGTLVEIGRMKGNLNINEKVFKIESSNLFKELSQTYNSPKEYKKIPLTANIKIKENELISMEIFGTKNTIYENICAKVSSEIIPEKALKSPITIQRIKEQISKTGNTQFEFSNISVELDEGLFIPKISVLNDLRRSAISELEKLAIKQYTRNLSTKSIKNFNIENKKELTKPKISLLLNIINEQFNYLNLENIDKLYIPLKFFIDNKFSNILTQLCNNYSVYLYLPPVIRDNKKFDLQNLFKKFLIKGAIISNISQINLFNNIPLIGNYNLNIFNKFSAEELKNYNICTYTISPELDKNSILNLNKSTSLKSELIVYGKIPLMTNNYCYLSSSNKCFKDCSKICNKKNGFYLKDRLGFKFRIIPDSTNNLTTIFNSKITSIKYDNLLVDNVRIDILDESISEIKNIINTVYSAERLEGNEYTNGRL